MTRELAAAVMVAVAVVLLGLIVWAWRRRVRRDQALTTPRGELQSPGLTHGSFEVLHVATTRPDEPLERLAVAGLAFRTVGDLSVTDGGLTLDLVGQQRIPIVREHILGVEQATVAIDRVVERGGLVRVRWQLDAEHTVDSYFRPRGASARAVADTVREIIPTGTAA